MPDKWQNDIPFRPLQIKDYYATNAPLPWQAKRDSEAVTATESEWWVADSRGREVVSIQNHTNSSSDTLKSRALLFAGAPDMLDAIDDVLIALDNPRISGEELEKAKHHLKHAWEKATGLKRMQP